VKNPKLCSLASEKETEEIDNDRGDRNNDAVFVVDMFVVDVMLNHHILTNQIKHVIRTSSDSDMIFFMVPLVAGATNRRLPIFRISPPVNPT
jgi:hypothetical protein